MLIVGLIEWVVIVTACYLGMSFDPTRVQSWLEEHTAKSRSPEN